MKTIRANVDKKFIRRFLIISIGCFLFMLWGLYDGLYTYPSKLRKSHEYEKLAVQLESGELTEDERGQEWIQITEENGWSLTKPDEAKNIENGIKFQWVIFGVGLVLGIFFLIKYIRLLGTWVEGDDSKLSTSWGQTIHFKNIQQINKTKWAKKGIAKIEYAEENGASKQMVFDDFKYDQKAMGNILAQAEKDLSKDQIVGGVSEAEKALAPEKTGEDTDVANEKD